MNLAILQKILVIKVTNWLFSISDREKEVRGDVPGVEAK